MEPPTGREHDDSAEGHGGLHRRVGDDPHTECRGSASMITAAITISIIATNGVMRVSHAHWYQDYPWTAAHTGGHRQHAHVRQEGGASHVQPRKATHESDTSNSVGRREKAQGGDGGHVVASPSRAAWNMPTPARSRVGAACKAAHTKTRGSQGFAIGSRSVRNSRTSVSLWKQAARSQLGQATGLLTD